MDAAMNFLDESNVLDVIDGGVCSAVCLLIYCLVFGTCFGRQALQINPVSLLLRVMVPGVCVTLKQATFELDCDDLPASTANTMTAAYHQKYVTTVWCQRYCFLCYNLC